MNPAIHILIVDDHKIVREGIKAFLHPIADFDVLGEANNGQEAIALAKTLHPDVILLDLIMPEMDGITATIALRKQNPEEKILIITSFADDEKVIAAIRAGALGYLIKDSSPHELEEAIRAVYQGDSYLPPRIARKVIRQLSSPEKEVETATLLSRRELEILQLIADGLSNDEIAGLLVISPWTVRSHLGRIMKKLQVENRTQAAMKALRAGMVKMKNKHFLS